MIIEKIEHNKGVTLTFDNRELCVLSNVLHAVEKNERFQEDSTFNELHRDIYAAFEIMSHAHIDSTAVRILQELQQAIDRGD